jgi:tetratricopeptide (TPR) repeat protein
MGIRSLVYREGKRTGFFRVVSAASGHPGLPDVTVPTINRDHFALCKPTSRDDQVYLGVCKFIRDCLEGRADVAAEPAAGPAAPAAPPAAAPVQPAAPPTPPLLPVPPRLFGRDEERDELVAALLDGNDSPIAVLGQAGIGKSALTLAAVQSTEAIVRFGHRRWFVRLETATEARAIWTSILAALGEEPGPQPDPQALALLGAAPGALVLDNGETPWYADTAGAEAAFAALAAVPGLKLIVSIRGQQAPYGPLWRRIPAVMDRLAADDAKALFLSLAGNQLADDPQLDALLHELDGLPLAIRLIAHLAQGEQNIAGLLANYRTRRTGLAIGAGKDQSLAASIQLSLDSPRLDDTARRLFAMIGRLPAGLADAHADALIDGGRAAALTLRQTGIASGDAEGRTRLLAPIRQDAAGRPLSEADEAALAEHYFGLAKREGEKVGAAGGREAAAQLRPEIGNIENLARLAAGVDAGSPCAPMAKAAIDAAYGLAELMRFTGIGSAETVRHLASIAKDSGDTLGEANCVQRLGDIAFARSDRDAARTAYEKALTLYRQIGETLGEANCIKSLGDVALVRSDHGAARATYEDALSLYRRIGDKLGEANCIQRLGDVAFGRSDRAAARTAYEQAALVYREVGDTLGEANSIKKLGDIAFVQPDRDTAHTAYEEALVLYLHISDPYSIGGTHRRLARITDGEARARHIAAAREAWGSIDLDDLIAELDQEFA